MFFHVAAAKLDQLEVGLDVLLFESFDDGFFHVGERWVVDGVVDVADFLELGHLGFEGQRSVMT